MITQNNNESIQRKLDGLIYANFFDFEGDGVERLLTIREQEITSYIMLYEIWDVVNDVATRLWLKEILIPERVNLFAVHKFEERTYFCHTAISDSDWGYFRTDYIYSIVNERVEEINRFRVVWSEVTHCPDSDGFVVDKERRFYINDFAVTEQEYRDALSKLGLEFMIINQRFETESGFVFERLGSEITFSNPIDISESVNYAPHIIDFIY